MKKYLFLLSFIIISSVLFTSCTEKKDPVPEQQSSTAADDGAGTSEADAALDDVNDIINNKIGGGASARTAAYNLPCGIIKFDSTETEGKKRYSLQYGGETPCGYKYKSGKVNFELIEGSKFNDTGAVYKVTFIDYKAEVRATGRTITVNGFRTVTNTSGGYIFQAVTESKTIVHQLRGAITVTFNDGIQRPREFFQRRTWSSTDGWTGLSFTANGDTTIDGKTVSETGKTYENDRDYITEVNKPLVWRNCGDGFQGPYVLQEGEATTHITVPAISPAYYNVVAGYYVNPNNAGATPELKQNCTSNAYKISVVIGTATSTQYQLY